MFIKNSFYICEIRFAYMRIKTIIILALMSSLLIGCGDDRIDSRLVRIDAMMDDNPRGALDSLERIDRAEMSAGDSFYYELLKIKASDKAYVRHESDSEVIKVIDYYKSHGDDDLYAEALYYGGRVYSDLGDYPTSLRYFQDALDRLPADTDNQKLRGHVLSQTGRLLNKLRLYDEAAKYLVELVKLDSVYDDSVNLVLDQQLLGAVLVHSGQYDRAKKHFKNIRSLSETTLPENTAVQDMYLAAIECDNGNLDSALLIIRGVPESVPDGYRSTAIAYAAEIYHNAGLYDSAYMYSKMLLDSKVLNYRLNAYKILLSSEEIKLVDKDDIMEYIESYNQDMDDYINSFDSEQIVTQNSCYNYNVHERERLKAERSRDHMWIIVIAVFILLLFLCVVVIYLKYRNTRHLIKLHEALNMISNMKYRLGNVGSVCGMTEDPVCESIKSKTDADCLRQRLRNEILTLKCRLSASENGNTYILEPELMSEIQCYIDQERPIPENSDLWDKLRMAVMDNNGEFMNNLQTLADGKLKYNEINLALLIKCGFSPTQSAILFGRTKGTLTYRREILCKKLLGKKLGTKDMDCVIRML